MSSKYSKMTVAQLKEELSAQGLATSGVKADLIQRLTDAEGSGESSSAKAAPEEKAPAKRGAAKRKASEKEEEEEAEEEPVEKKESAAKKFKVDSAPKKTPSNVPVDKIAASKHSMGSAHVVVEPNCVWDVMLNQTNIAQNNNKYYVIQILERGGQYWTYNRWGRVGEDGQDALKACGGSLASAKSDFEKKFKDKTSNNWANGSVRGNFQKKAGKYDLLEMDYEGDDTAEVVEKIGETGSKKRKVRACSLDGPTEALMKLISDNDMFKEQLKTFNIDVKKMPLGKLSHAQLAKGFEVLEELQADLKAGKKSSIEPLSSKFFTAIPHDFGRKVPDPLRTLEEVQQKMDMLEVMGDIVTAQEMLKDLEQKDVEEVDHPLDIQYKKLGNELTVVDKKSDEYKIIETYFNNTKNQGSKLKLMEVWSLDRSGEKKRADKFAKLGNRKLLWHGTKVAVMCAILRDGLRIMPHSGGRVGRGLYFASENAKSAGYVGPGKEGNKNVGLMFLNEVILGKEHHITRDDSSLVRAPGDTNCVIAKGRVEPDPKDDTTMEGEWGTITVPQGKAINMPQYSGSSFFNSEYLVYDEGQVRMKYLCKIDFSW